MAAAWNKFFSVLVNLLGSVDSGASALNHIARMADEEAAALAETSAISRQYRVAQELKRLEAQSAA